MTFGLQFGVEGPWELRESGAEDEEIQQGMNRVDRQDPVKELQVDQEEET